MSKIIMVVDDSPTVVKFVSFSLKKSGFSVMTACDGMDALEKMSGMDKCVDLVITDLNMPNLDGYGLIEAMRQNERLQKTPIIILSSEQDNEDREKGIEVGADSYLVKPFKPVALLQEVGRYLKQTATA